MAKWTDPHIVLGISRGFEANELKQAYRKALLQYHPDKFKHNGSLDRPLYTIDDVNQAYSMLRKGYDNDEDLDDLDAVVNFNDVCDLSIFEEHELNDGTMEWIKTCRCGQQGYRLTELDLESNGDADEIAVQCAGCSLWILVQYTVEQAFYPKYILL